ncbi:MAG: CAP domain-containing protein [Bacteroidetes bacterium]|nr:CAP domain-containing protein [Bacteroidota bacterium]
MMRNTTAFLYLFLLFLTLAGNAQPFQKQVSTIPGNFRVSEEEMRLYRMINDYRVRYDLPPIPLSVSLCYVASAHVKDLFFHHPDQEPCNSHSWSDKGPWKPFCYPRDENKKNSVWDKPKEFTPYKDKGYEIVYWENNQVDIDSVINLWKTLDYFNSFLMNTGKWQGKKWEAIGVGIYENYACAWFGQVPDPYGPPLLVGENPAITVSYDTGKKKEAVKKPVPAVAVAVKPPPVADSTIPDTSKAGHLKYYIIVKSNVLFKDSAKFVKFYSEQGFPLSKSLTKEGKARISVFETFDRTEATAKLKEVKVKNKGAWILKINQHP